MSLISTWRGITIIVGEGISIRTLRIRYSMGFKASIHIFYISRERMRRSLSPLKRACPLPPLTVLLLVHHVSGNAMAATAMLPHLLLLFLARDCWCLLITGFVRRLAKSSGILLLPGHE